MESASEARDSGATLQQSTANMSVWSVSSSLCSPTLAIVEQGDALMQLGKFKYYGEKDQSNRNSYFYLLWFVGSAQKPSVSFPEETSQCFLL